MVGNSLLQRMRKLRALLAIKLGPGAVVLPKTVSRIHMRFAPHIDNGHHGSRKFWRHELIRLKYHNPAVPMTVDRNVPQTDAALMTVFFAPENATQTSGSATGSPAPTASTSNDKTPSEYTPAEKMETITMTGRSQGEILADLVRVTKAEAVVATKAEREELEELAREKVRSERESALSLAVREKKRREEDLLKQARGEMAAEGN